MNYNLNYNSNLEKAMAVKEIKDAVRAEHDVSTPMMSKSLDIFDTLLIAVNGLCCKYSLSYEDHKIIVHVFKAVSYPERTFTIDVIEGRMKASFL